MVWDQLFNLLVMNWMIVMLGFILNTRYLYITWLGSNRRGLAWCHWWIFRFSGIILCIWSYKKGIICHCFGDSVVQTVYFNQLLVEIWSNLFFSCFQSFLFFQPFSLISLKNIWKWTCFLVISGVKSLKKV